MARTSADLGEMDESGPVGMEDRPDLTYLVQIDPIFSVLCDHLPTRDRLRLRDVSRTFRAVVTESPSTWQHLDLSGRSRDVVVDVMRFAAVPGALTSLVLDCTDVSEMTIVVLLTRCPNLRHLGLGGAMQLMEGVLQAVSTAKRNGHAVRLKSLGLLGAPHFTASGINGIAASVTREFETLGITTDLRPCPREHVFTAHPDEQWHLCAENPMRCRSCGKLERGCYPCLNGRTCRGCHKFWCFDCESSITRVCYECGHSCRNCKVGIYVKCTECGSMFCKLHREDDVFPPPRSIDHQTRGRTQTSEVKTSLATIGAAKDTCDWCIQGKATAFRERFRC